MAKKAGTRKAGSTARTRGTKTSKAAPASRARGRKTSAKRAGGRKKAARKRPAARRQALPKATARKAAPRKKPTSKARPKIAAKKTRKSSARKATAKRPARKSTTTRRAAPRKAAATRKAKAPAARRGARGMEQTLAQTPKTGRTVAGPTNPKPTKRSTGTPAGAGSTRRAPGLDRERRQLREVEEGLPTPPSSLDMDRLASAARSGRREMLEERREHHETSPVMTAGDVDADWEDAYAVGDEAPGGDNPTPDQDRVDDIGKALGVQYEDNEELKGSDKIAERDKHRWELDPASSDDYLDRD